MRVRLICEAARVVAGWKLDSGDQPGPLVTRHLGGCAHCRAWLATQTSVCEGVRDFAVNARKGWSSAANFPISRLSTRATTHAPADSFPWGRLLTLTGAFAAMLAALAVWQPWQTQAPIETRPLEQWRIAFQETLKKAEEPSALEKEFQSTLRDAERAMTAVANGVASHDLIVSWSGGN